MRVYEYGGAVQTLGPPRIRAQTGLRPGSLYTRAPQGRRSRETGALGGHSRKPSSSVGTFIPTGVEGTRNLGPVAPVQHDESPLNSQRQAQGTLSSRSLIGHSTSLDGTPRTGSPASRPDEWVVIAGVHSPRCLPSHCPNTGKAVESGHSPILTRYDALHINLKACITVAVALMPTVLANESLLLPIRTLHMSAQRESRSSCVRY